MMKSIKDYAILMLCFVAFFIVIFFQFRFDPRLVSIWQLPNFDVNTLKVVTCNLPWLGLSFFYFIKMRSNFENSFTLRLLRHQKVINICLDFNRQVLKNTVGATLLYLFLAYLVNAVVNQSWLVITQEVFFPFVTMFVVTFLIGIGQLMLSLFFDPRLGLLCQLSYSVLSLLIGRLLVQNGVRSFWQQLLFWPQWLTGARIVNCHYSVINILMGFSILLIILELGVFVSIKRKDWLG